MTNPLSIEDQRNSQCEDRNVNPSHGAKGARVARLDPTIDSVEEAERHDVLDEELANVPCCSQCNGYATYLESINKQQRISVDRQITIADICHSSDRHKRKAYSHHAIAEESAPKHQHISLSTHFKEAKLTTKSNAIPPHHRTQKPSIQQEQ